MSKKPIFNALTQKVEDATLSVDDNNEVVATFKDGSFLKFPAGITPEEFDAQIQAHQTSNEGQEVITPEMEAARVAERAASLALIGDTTPESQSNDNPDETPTE